MTKMRLNSLTVALIIFALSKCFFLGSFVPYMLNRTGTSSVLSILIGGVFSFFILKIILKSFHSGKGTIVSKINDAFGKKFGTILNILIVLAYFSLLSLLIFRLVSFTSTEFLNETPTFIIGLIVCSLLFYLSTRDFNNFLIFANVSFFICAMFIIFNITGVVGYAELDNLKPYLSSDFHNILTTALYFSIFFTSPLFLLLIIPKESIIDLHNFNKYIYIFTGLSFIVIFLMITLTISVLGIELASIFQYPEFIVLQAIGLFSFIQNTESASVILWVFYILLTSTAIIYYIKSVIFEVISIDKKRNNLITFVISFISFVLSSFLFNKDFIIERFNLVGITFYLLSFIILILVLYLFKSGLVGNKSK